MLCCLGFAVNASAGSVGGIGGFCGPGRNSSIETTIYGCTELDVYTTGSYCQWSYMNALSSQRNYCSSSPCKGARFSYLMSRVTSVVVHTDCRL